MSKAYDSSIIKTLNDLIVWAEHTAESSTTQILPNSTVLLHKIDTLHEQLDEFGLPIISPEQQLRAKHDEILHQELINQIKAQEQIIEDLRQQLIKSLQKQKPIYQKIVNKLYKIGQQGKQLADKIAFGIKNLYLKAKNKLINKNRLPKQNYNLLAANLAKFAAEQFYARKNKVSFAGFAPEQFYARKSGTQAKLYPKLPKTISQIAQIPTTKPFIPAKHNTNSTIHKVSSIIANKNKSIPELYQNALFIKQRQRLKAPTTKKLPKSLW